MDHSSIVAVLDRHRSAVIALTVVVCLAGGAATVRALAGSGQGAAPAGTLRVEQEPTNAGTAEAPSATASDAPAVGGSQVPGPASAQDGTASAAEGEGSGAARGGAAGDGDGAATDAAPAGSGAADSAGTVGDRGPATATGSALPGVTDEEVTVVYYWKGDRTRTSPYLAGSGAEGNVDEAKAFRTLIDWINANDGKGMLMGHPIDLHGRTLRGVVVEAGSSPEDYAATAERITEEIQPFVAVAAHGSISTYLCPALADAGIHNLATYDLGGDLVASTDGYCMPSGLPWERQVDLTERYLVEQQAADPTRVYGVVYAEYPELVDSAPRMVQRLRNAGVNIAEVATVSASLTTAQQQAPNIIARMRAAGVNTVVFPDAGAPITLTHSAQAQGYQPDYYVWPCSGQDTMGMVRILNGANWDGAEGLTCYDEAFASDVRSNDAMKATEWYRAYQEIAGDEEPPAPTPFVYQSLLPLVAGLHRAGPDLSLESWRGALAGFTPYRYDAVEGRTTDGTRMRIELGSADRAMIGDAIPVRYDASAREPGAPAPGDYVFGDDTRWPARAR